MCVCVRLRACVCGCVRILVCLQVRQTKDKVLRKKDLYKVAEAEVLSLGRKLHGPGFVLGATTPRELDMKRKVEVADGGVRMS